MNPRSATPNKRNWSRWSTDFAVSLHTQLSQRYTSLIRIVSEPRCRFYPCSSCSYTRRLSLTIDLSSFVHQFNAEGGTSRPTLSGGDFSLTSRDLRARSFNYLGIWGCWHFCTGSVFELFWEEESVNWNASLRQKQSQAGFLLRTLWRLYWGSLLFFQELKFTGEKLALRERFKVKLLSL